LSWTLLLPGEVTFFAEELWLPLQGPFFSSLVCMRTNHLATKCNYYARNAAGVQGVFEESLASLVNDSSVNTAYIYILRKLVRTDLLLCDRWQNSAQACFCC